MTYKTVLVVGASGFVGNAVMHRFAGESDCRVIGLCRSRPSSLPAGSQHLAADLLDPADCRRAVQQLKDVTHVVYAAVNETPGDLVASWTDPDHAARNGRMLSNLMDPLLETADGLSQVILMHGTKAYASHRPDNRPPVPMRESLPRPDHDDFYFRQEDYLWSRQRGQSWGWTVLRAPMIAGGGLGSNLNALLAIAVFAVLRRERGLPLRFPGAGHGEGVMEMVDVELLARAVSWATGSEAARNQVFNVANGDVYTWPDLWPIIAEEMGAVIGDPEPRSLAEAVAADAGLWAQLVHRHRLAAPADWRDFLGESCALADFALNHCDRTVVTSTIKIRQAGFADCVDTSASVIGWLRRWREQGLLPPC